MISDADFEIISTGINSVHDKCLEQLNGNIGNISPTLYHYTNLNASLEILKNGTLRFTDARYCNDPDELNEGICILARVHDEMHDYLLKSNPQFAKYMDILFSILIKTLVFVEADANDQIPEKCKDICKNAFSEKIQIPKTSVYISCFSEKCDDLRQWVPYSKNGEGVSIGFSGVNETHSLTQMQTHIVRVCYEKIERKEEYVRKMYEGMSKLFLTINENLYKKFMIFLQQVIMFDIIACKSENYKDENEWRLVHICTNNNKINDTNFLISDSIVKPFIDVQIIKGSLKEIILGPKAANALNIHSFEKILEKHHFDAKVTKSKVNYR